MVCYTSIAGEDNVGEESAIALDRCGYPVVVPISRSLTRAITQLHLPVAKLSRESPSHAAPGAYNNFPIA